MIVKILALVVVTVRVDMVNVGVFIACVAIVLVN